MPNPFALEGAAFLVFLAPVLVAAACLGRVIRSLLRSPGPRDGDADAQLDWERAAYLAGGFPRLTAAAVARLVACGAAQLAPGGRHLVRGHTIPEEGLSVVETVVHNLLPTENTGEGLKPVVDAVGVRFSGEASVAEADGLVLTADAPRLFAWACVVPVLLVVLGLAVPHLVMSLLAFKPSLAVLGGTLLGGAAAGAVAATGPARLTRRGEAILDGLQARYAGRGLATPDDAAMAVALFGVGALAGTKLSEVRAGFA